MTQLDYIRRHFYEKGSLTNVEAAAMFKARSLTKQVSLLRREGLNIASEWKRDTTGQRYVKYKLLGKA